MNNLATILQKRLQIRLVGDIVYDNTGESKITCYKDLWRSKSQHSEMIEYGIANSNLQKLTSNYDQGTSGGNFTKGIRYSYVFYLFQQTDKK